MAYDSTMTEQFSTIPELRPQVRLCTLDPMVEATISIGDFEHVREGVSLYTLYGTLSGPLKTRALVYSSYIKANSGAAMIQIILHRH